MSELEGNTIKASRSKRTAPEKPTEIGNGVPAVELSSSPVLYDEPIQGYVRCRVMKRGDNRIATGVTLLLEEVKFPFFQKGDELNLPRLTADKYEDAGWVEILGGIDDDA